MPTTADFQPRKPRHAPAGKVFGGRHLRPLNSPPLSVIEASEVVDPDDDGRVSRSQSLGDEGEKSLQQEPPKHAWWRGLLAWQGNADASLAGEPYCMGGSFRRNCISPTSSKSSTPSLPQSQVATQRSGSFTGSSARPPPSDHLRWAKHVRACQKQWLRDHYILTKPRPFRTSTKARRDAHRKLVQKSPIPPVRDWNEALRDKQGLVLPPADWQEKKAVRLKRTWALNRLKQQQLKWLQDHKKWDQRRLQKLSDSQMLEEEEEEEDELGDEEDVGELTPVASMMGKLAGRGSDGSDSANQHVPFLRTRTHRDSNRPSNLNMQLIDGTGTPASGDPASPQSYAGSSAPSSPKSPAYSEASLGENAMRRDMSWGSHSSGGRQGTGKSPAENADDKPGGRASDSAIPSRLPSNVASSRNSTVEGVEEWHSGRYSAWGEIFNENTELADGRWTPSVISGPSGAPSGNTSKRASDAFRGPSPPNEEAEDLGDKQRNAIPEEDDESATKMNTGDEEIALPAQKSLPVVSRKQRRKEQKEGGVRQMSRLLTMETWEEWRTDFPLEVLNVLADFYESFTGDSDGRRLISIGQLEAVTSRVLGFPPKAVTQEAEAKGLAAPATPSSNFLPEVLFKSLPHFFLLIRGTVERVQNDEAEFLWSSDDLHQLAVIFHKHENAHGRLPVAHLFNVIADLGFEELNVSDVKQQKWLAGVTQSVIEKQNKFRGRQTITDPSQVGSLTFQDLCRIVTAALHSKEKERRHMAFAAERRVRKQVGFSPIEMEDLRELHDTYLSVEVQGNNGALPRLITLFHICSVRELSHDEVDLLKDTIARNTAEQIPGEDPSMVSFPTFMLWMRDVFQNRIGDLQWHYHQSVVPGADRKGFAAAMLRDQCRAAGMTSPKASEAGSSSMVSTRRGSFDLSVPSRRSSGTSPGAFNLGKMLAMSQAPSSFSSRHNSISLQGGSKGSALGRVSRGSSRNNSRFNSRRGSRENSRSNSLFTDAADLATGLKEQNDDAHKAVFLMKGLPPQEAMLARKQYRAISVDLSNAGTSVGPAAAIANESKVSESTLSSKAPDEEKLPSISAQLAQQVQMRPGPSMKPEGQAPSKSRSVKQGLDPEMLVAGAVAKLTLVQRSVTPDGDAEEEGGNDD
mmetsp:Transcript_136532/g.254990  ORF Transcript_136532/g.254990 Transcript_136532/m.254990 type:complete len:1139 (-) Transcript_136532:8-3424(-)